MKTIQLPDELYKQVTAHIEPGESVDEKIIAWLKQAVESQETTARFFRARRTGRTPEEAAASGRALLFQLAERQRKAQEKESSCET